VRWHRTLPVMGESSTQHLEWYEQSVDISLLTVSQMNPQQPQLKEAHSDQARCFEAVYQPQLAMVVRFQSIYKAALPAALNSKRCCWQSSKHSQLPRAVKRVQIQVQRLEAGASLAQHMLAVTAARATGHKGYTLALSHMATSTATACTAANCRPTAATARAGQPLTNQPTNSQQLHTLKKAATCSRFLCKRVELLSVHTHAHMPPLALTSGSAVQALAAAQPS
jgi:hypothetical protein